MGSRGSGSFSDYSKKSGGKKGAAKGRGPRGGGGASGGGSSGEDICAKAIGDISLEEVARCEYYKNHSDVPRVSSHVRVRRGLVAHRLGVENDKGELLGYLPTEYNYLAGCMEQGYSYVGLVKSSLGGRVPRINIDLRPSK